MNLKKLRLIILILVVIMILVVIALFIINNNKKINFVEDIGEEPEIVVNNVDNVLKDMTVYIKLRNQISALLRYKQANNEQALQEIAGDINIFQNVVVDLKVPVMLDIVYRTGDTMNNFNFIKFRQYKQEQSYYAVIILDIDNNTYKIIESTEEEYENAKLRKI